jgi:hypothetical protein
MRTRELQLCLDQDYQNARYVRRSVAPGDGEFARFQPAAGIRWDTTTSRSSRLPAWSSP